MDSGCQCLWVTITVLAFCLQIQVIKSQNLTCHSVDLSSLRDFFVVLDSTGDLLDYNSSTDCCNWVGITCNSSSSLGLSSNSVDSGRVVKLELSDKKLTGNLSESIGRLDQLRTLNLSFNSLKQLPVSLFHLPKLEVVDLKSNDISGQIPSSTNLPSLKYLDISDNYIEGSVPTQICVNSTRIKVLSLTENMLSGDVLTGFGNCTSLDTLSLGRNGLIGGISEDIFQLKNLSLLNLQSNQLSGELSSSIGNLTNLVGLDISSNRFVGFIPDVFYDFNKIKDFIANSNNFDGSIPRSLSNSPSLNLLNLRNNSLSGSLTLNCSAMKSLTSLELGTNKFNGSIPDYLPSCRVLKSINLARNSFLGQIPESFKNFESLAYLSLSNANISNISSALHILQQCDNLDTLVLTGNFRGEEIPDDYDISFKNLTMLVIANCGLTGSLPQWLSSSSKLQFLDISWNHLNGSIPSWFGKMEDLFYLDVSNNSFTGEIPKNLTSMASLISRNISLENAANKFPFFIRRSNESVGRLQYNQVDNFPPTLDLGYNLLTGSIWPEFGKLKKLHALNLEHNFLSGKIPSELSGMTSLETMDLSHNNLDGEIPSSLEALTFLSKFDVSYNRLDGQVPSGKQFATFPDTSFEGNNLCWAGSCEESVRKSKPRRNNNAAIGTIIGVVLGTSFVFLLLVLMVLRANRRRVLVEVDPEKEEGSSKLLVLFKNNEEISVDEVLSSTNYFDETNIIGCGGFGLVYKANLPDGQKVAIKRLTGECGQMEREFQAEVEALSQAQHPNLVRLQGYCMYKHDRLLIYSYMENGSLDYWLHENFDMPSSLDWKTRLRIAQGSARGLAYLHQSCEPRILHRDIKSSNILLDENFEAHLADFGLARLILPYDTHVSTDLVGTLGYIPPEYGQASVATYKGDIYSFGVVLLELVTGKRPMDMCKPTGSRDLISWSIKMKKEERESEVFDTSIYDKEKNGKEVLRVFEIACACLSKSPKDRPSTQQLVSWLDEIGVVNIY